MSAMPWTRVVTDLGESEGERASARSFYEAREFRSADLPFTGMQAVFFDTSSSTSITAAYIPSIAFSFPEVWLCILSFLVDHRSR